MPSPSPTTSPQLTASQCEEALATLERLQDQLDNLRSALPRLIEPLTNPRQTGKAQMFAEIKKAALGAATDLQTFRESMTSSGTQDLLKQVRESESKDGNLTRAGEVVEFGWVEKVEGRR